MRRFTVLLAVLLMAGCGYHVQGRGQQMPGGINTVYVELFANGTLEPFLENTVTEFVVERFARGRALRVVNRPSSAEAVLSGQVTAYGTTPVAYARNDDILEYRATMAVSAVLRRTGTGELLWKGSSSWSEEYTASQDRIRQEDNEAAAMRVISERVAEELYFRLVDDF